MKKSKYFTIRAYAIVLNDNNDVLISDEYAFDKVDFKEGDQTVRWFPVKDFNS